LPLSSRLQAWLRIYGKSVYPFYAVGLFLLAVSLLSRDSALLRETFVALALVDIVVLFALCPAILLLGFPSSRLGYVSFDRITQAGLIWLLGPAASAVFNAVASLIFPFHIRAQTGNSRAQALLRALHNAGMIILTILAGGLAFRLAGGSAPVSALTPALILPVAATIVSMQLVNGLFVRIRVALTDGRIRIPVDWFANTLEPAAALIGLLTVMIAINTDRVLTLSYLFVLMALMFTVKRLSDSRQRLEEKVQQRTAEIEAQNQRLEMARVRQQELVEKLERLSREDELTGLCNRRHMDEFLRQEKERLQRYGGTLAIALMDIDHFKEVNDRYSHQLGDKVLMTVAEILQHEARSTDLVSRYGGEEFVIALPNADEDGARQVIERCREAVQSHPWERLQAGLSLSISGGVAVLDEDMDLQALFRRADQRLYQAKDQGRNRIVVSD